MSEVRVPRPTPWANCCAGVPLTLELTVISVSVGVVLAVMLALLRASFAPFAWFVRGYVFVLRGTPLLLQIFLIYYGLGQFAVVRSSVLWPFLRQPYWCAILALTLNTAAYGSEIIRGGLQSVPAGRHRGGAGLRHVRRCSCIAASSCRSRCARRCRPTATK